MIIIIMILAIVLDISSKIIVINNIEFNEEIDIISNFFKMTYVRNTGAAWSIMDDRGYIVQIISIMIILGIIWYLYKNKPENKVEIIAYGLILGGAIGNLLDRVIHGYVIDFISIKILGYNYPIFNLADIFIVSGVIILMIYTWRYGKYGDRSR